jgi:hypothetical protein
VEIELSVTFAPELGETVRADGQARILEEAEQERRFQGLREALDEYQTEHGAFTDEEMARASEKLGLPWPPEENSE